MALPLFLQGLNLIFCGNVHSQERPETTGPQGQEIEFVSNPTDAFGYLNFKTNIDSFYVYVDGDIENYKKISRFDSLKLSVGTRKITISSEFIRDKTFDIEIVENTVMEYRINFGSKILIRDILLENSSYPRIYHRANLIVLTDDKSDIFIDGEWAGRGEVKVDTLIGLYVVETRHKHAGSSKKKIKVKSNRLAILKMYNKPHRKASKLLSAFPGASQFYQKRRLIGIFIFGITVAGAVITHNYHQTFKDKNNEYEILLSNYRNANTEANALRLGDQLQSAFDSADDAAQIRNVFLYATLGAYALNLLDAILMKQKSGYRLERKFNLYAEIPSMSKHNLFRIGFKSDF